MIAAWYERQGPAYEVLVVREMPDPYPAAGEVRIRLAAAGINPGEVKKRQNAFGVGMPFPGVIPHSDGAGIIDMVGEGLPASRVGERVWCYGAQSYRPFGTAAEYVVVPSAQAVPLPAGISFEQGACLGIPGITAHRAVHSAGSVDGQTILVQGGAGAVGSAAVGLAHHAGARVIATVRSERDEQIAQRAGADSTVRTDTLSDGGVVERIRALAPGGVQHVIEVAFDANIAIDEAVLVMGGSIATYATGNPTPAIPFWSLLFKNVRLYFLGSDDFPPAVKRAAAHGVNEMLEAGWPGFVIDRQFPLPSIAEAHDYLERGDGDGRVVITLAPSLDDRMDR